VFLALCDLFPEADLFTAVYYESGTEGRFADRRPTTSFLQRVRPDARTFRALLPLYPHAMEALDLRDYDLVISSSSAWAHGVIPDPDAVHLCYSATTRSAMRGTPARRRWRSTTPLRRAMLGFVFQRWRQWDWIAAQRVDLYAANSEITRKRVKRYFGRDATVLYPPVETARFQPGAVGNDYVVLSELMPHKRIDLAVEAFNELELPLTVVGTDPMRGAYDGSPGRTSASRGGSTTRRQPSCSALRRRSSSPPPRSSASRPWRPRQLGARSSRCARAACARRCWRARPARSSTAPSRGRWPTRSAASTRWRSIRPRASRTPSASMSRTSVTGCARWSIGRSRPSARRARARAAPAASRCRSPEPCRMPSTVVVPAWNGERWLPGLFASLAAQTQPPAEVVVVDNGLVRRDTRVARA